MQDSRLMIERSDVLLLFVMIGYCVFCPYTKVEESFNMQAIHDLIEYDFGLSTKLLQKFDHFDFPGVVPRSFLGAIVVAFFTLPFSWLRLLIKFVTDKNLSKLILQISARLVLGFISWLAFLSFRQAVTFKFSRRAGQLLSLIVATQFHIPFYMSRTIPNTYALIGLLLAHGQWLRGNALQALVIIAPFAIIFRCDLLILIVPWVIQLLICKEITFLKSVWIGNFVCLFSICLTIVVDSYFWHRGSKLLYPEGVVLFYNSIENKSSNWGISPLMWYFTNVLPKSLHIWLPFAFVSLLELTHPLLAIQDKFIHAEDHDSPIHGLSSSTSLSRSNSLKSINSSDSLSSFSSSTSASNGKPKLIDLSFRGLISLMCSSIRFNKVMYYSFPALCFVTLYSLLPHKELRFIYPVALPVLSVAAAVGLDRLIRIDAEHTLLMAVLGSLLPASMIPDRRLWTVRTSKRTSKNIFLFDLLLSITILLSFVFSLTLSHVSLFASHQNYPGAVALSDLLNIEIPSCVKAARLQNVNFPQVLKIHIDASPAMSGITRFLQEDMIEVSNDRLYIEYSKKENISSKELADFHWLVATVEQSMNISSNFVKKKDIDGFSHLKLSFTKPRIQYITVPTYSLLMNKNLLPLL